jgi:ubiquinone/menaquinone biosynthesis C-methylase UbiE
MATLDILDFKRIWPQLSNLAQNPQFRDGVQKGWGQALRVWAHGRSVVFTLEGGFLPIVEFLASGQRPQLPTDRPELFRAARRALTELIEEDLANIRSEIYPWQVLLPESPRSHLRRMPKLFWTGYKSRLQKHQQESKTFSPEARALAEETPDYYRRNFHFQIDGYLSRDSAELYDHQVEVLFAGAADAMRRLLLPPLVRAQPQRVLELGAGTGRSTRFLKMALPQARLTALDLSSPYLRVAAERLRDLPWQRFDGIDYVQADAASTPFRDASFDAVASVFLFHELPLEERRRVLAEAFRVLRSGGVLAIVDSLQSGDRPELQEALDEFPVQYHEPFYKNYLAHPLADLAREAGFEVQESGTGFFAKLCVARKP